MKKIFALFIFSFVFLIAGIQAQSEKPTVARTAFWADENLGVEVYLVNKINKTTNYSLMVVANKNVRIFYHTSINSMEPVLKELSPVKIIKGRRYYEFTHNFTKMTIWMSLEFKLKGKRIDSLTRTFYNDIFDIVPNGDFLK